MVDGDLLGDLGLLVTIASRHFPKRVLHQTARLCEDLLLVDGDRA